MITRALTTCHFLLHDYQNKTDYGLCFSCRLRSVLRPLHLPLVRYAWKWKLVGWTSSTPTSDMASVQTPSLPAPWVWSVLEWWRLLEREFSLLRFIDNCAVSVEWLLIRMLIYRVWAFVISWKKVQVWLYWMKWQQFYHSKCDNFFLFSFVFQ